MQGLKRHVLLGGTATGTGGGITDPNLRLNFIYEGYSVAETRYTFSQLIDFTRTSAGTFVNSSGNIASTPQSRNLLTFTNEFANVAWTKTNLTVSANVTAAPDGTMTADKLVKTATTSDARLGNFISVAGNVTFSIYLKAAEQTNALVYIENSAFSGTAQTVVNLSTGGLTNSTTGTGVAITSTTATAVGNGWYRVTLSVNVTSGTAVVPRVIPCTAAGATNILGDGVSGFFAWGAQLEASSTATDYTRNFGGLFTPRFDYDPVTRAPRGLLIEEQRTNLFLQSVPTSTGSPWNQSIALTVTANATAAPDGTTSAFLAARTATSSAYVGQAITKAASAIQYTYSAYVKRSIGDFVALRMQGTFPSRADAIFNLSTGVVTSVVATSTFTGATATITPAGNGWFRITLTATSDTATTLTSYFSFNSNGVVIDGTDSANNSAGFFWGAQLEAGAFATSYIPTVASQVTRTADQAAINAPNFASWYNAAQGTIVADYATFIPVSAIVSSTPTSFAINDGTVNNSIHSFSAAASPGLTRGTVATGGVTQAAMDVTPALLSGKIALAYATNDFAFSAGGSAAVTDTSGTVPSVNSLQLGRLVGAATLNGWIRSLRYYPTRLTNAQLQALTA